MFISFPLKLIFHGVNDHFFSILSKYIISKTSLYTCLYCSFSTYFVKLSGCWSVDSKIVLQEIEDCFSGEDGTADSELIASIASSNTLSIFDCHLIFIGALFI
jgi:hypothetical protein